MADRLGELNKADIDDADIGDTGVNNQAAQEYFNQYDVIKKGLNQIKKNVNEIEILKEVDRNIVNDKKRKENMDKVDAVMARTNTVARQLKKKLDELKTQNEQYKRSHKDDVATVQMRNNLYQTYIRNFHQIMNEYNSVAHEFKQNLQDRTRRQLKIIDENIPDDDVDKIIASGKANGIIKQALISEKLEDVIRDIEERHMDILKLEQQVLEVYNLFQDLATLVDIQQESLDVIENRIEHAKEYAEKAEEELKQAEVYQKKSKKRCCCALIILLVLLLIILIPILLSVIKTA